MCGRVFAHDSVFIDLPVFGIWVRGEFKGSSNIAPSETVAIIHKENDKLVADPMTWGYSPGWDKGPRFIVNLKSETILEKKFAQSSLRSKRCILPVSGFFEWKQESPKHKIPYAFLMEDKSTFGVAALYFEKTNGGKECVLLTAGANVVVGQVHDRMPVLLTPDHWNDWIYQDDTAKVLTDYAKPFVQSKMTFLRVDEAFNKAGYKGELHLGTQ